MKNRSHKLCYCNRCTKCVHIVKPKKKCQCNKMNTFDIIDFYFTAYNQTYNTGNYPCRCKKHHH